VESESGQAIFKKPRITAKKIEARFAIDVGLLSSLRLDTVDGQGRPGQHQDARFQLLAAIALWKVASFLKLLEVELSLRTECKLRLKQDDAGQAIVTAKCEPNASAQRSNFAFTTIAAENLTQLISTAGLPQGRSPLVFRFAS
jgi:hypothetical protein